MEYDVKSRKLICGNAMITRNTLKYYLKKLKNTGVIEHIGTSRGGYWRVK